MKNEKLACPAGRKEGNNKYKVSLEISGKIYNVSGDSLDECFKKLNLSWAETKGKGIIKINKGKQSFEYPMQRRLLMRIFANKVARFVWSKNLVRLMGWKCD